MSEIATLTENQIGLFKRTRMDSTISSDSVNAPDWSKELYSFTDIVIKPAVWKTDFAYVDVVHDPNEVSEVFETTNPRQKIKKFKIKTNDTGDIIRFTAEIVDHGKLAHTVTLLSYTKNVGYTISIERDTKLIGNESYQIVGQFYKNKNLKNN